MDLTLLLLVRLIGMAAGVGEFPRSLAGVGIRVGLLGVISNTSSYAGTHSNWLIFICISDSKDRLPLLLPRQEMLPTPALKENVSLQRGKQGILWKTGTLLNSGSFVVIQTSVCDRPTSHPHHGNWEREEPLWAENFAASCVLGVDYLSRWTHGPSPAD